MQRMMAYRLNGALNDCCKYAMAVAVIRSCTSCALSPQLVALRPVVEVATADYGAQRDINVRVEDHRPSPVIGTRGGVYGNTSTIEVGNDYRRELSYTLASALTRWGFRSAVDGYRGNAVEFQVSLDRLSYQPDRSVAGKTVVDAEVSLVVERDDRVYHGHYQATGELRYATAPSEEKNQEEINRVLGAALQQLFDDAGLIAFLQ